MTSISKEQLQSILAQIEIGNVVFICEKTIVYLNNFESKVVSGGSRKRITTERTGEGKWNKKGGKQIVECNVLVDVVSHAKRPPPTMTVIKPREEEVPVPVVDENMDKLRKLFQNKVTGCMFCFCEGKPSSHYLGKCPSLIGKCKRCFKTAEKNTHNCVARGSLPNGRRICFLCGLTNEHHASGTWGTVNCQTWASDKLLCMATIFWTCDDKYKHLKRRPQCARRSTDGEMIYVEFYDWLFNFDENNQWNYVSFLLHCFENLKIQ
jgi:hypothetical protein